MNERARSVREGGLRWPNTSGPLLRRALQYIHFKGMYATPAEYLSSASKIGPGGAKDGLVVSGPSNDSSGSALVIVTKRIE
jgi:hypothetical protein